MNVIESEGISKSFGQTKALDNLSFTVGESELFGFIGPDGAGKTTLFRLITSLILPDSGRLSVLGMDTRKDYRKLRSNIGYMPGRFSLYQDLTVEENLKFYATVFGTTVEENYELIEDIYSHIEPFRDRPAGKLSGGMKQKLALSCALIHRPPLLVLDEPTTGVDAVSRAEFWTMLEKLRKFRITVIVSTPYMDEASRCNRVALIQGGKILAIDTPSNVREGFTGVLYSVRAASKFNLINSIRKFAGTTSAWPFGDSVHVTLEKGYSTGMLNDWLLSLGITDASISEITAGIEDRFLELMPKGNE
ncbi:MAG: ABC transporter ATP-binding protein [Bacteroidales bacterium]